MRATIIGAGALGLGYLAERLAPDYELCLVDRCERAPWLRAIACEQGYWLTVCGSGIEARRVSGSFEAICLDESGGRERLSEVLGQTDIVLTAVGRANLGSVVEVMGPALHGRSRALWVLFCENGHAIAETHAGRLGQRAIGVDTVMSRMCRFAEPEEASGYRALCAGGPAQTALVVEPYSFLPLDATRCAGGPFSPVFSLVATEVFALWEDVKLFLHNGMHAFVACHAHLMGVRTFSEVPVSLRERARMVAQTELVPALTRVHRVPPTLDLAAYADELLGRFFSPCFRDSVARGIRGVVEKLEPGERILGGCELIRRAGIEPRGYSTLIRAARRVLESQRLG
jgi:hypothetical protein